MRTHWLRGTLLGVSLALLLAGGVAVAAGLYVSINRDCVECVAPDTLPRDDQFVTITFGGWDQALSELCKEWLIDGDPVPMTPCGPTPPIDPIVFRLYFRCEDSVLSEPLPFLAGIDVSALPVPPRSLGTHVWRLSQKDEGGNVVDRASGSYLVAEDCAAAMFVPEPSSLLLLGSGVAGLAGYATLRWRSKQ
jgi:hypothetical protein